MIKNIHNTIIVYNPGFAGNFLSRLFSLDTSVCPQVKIGWAENNIDIFDQNRLDLYSFDEAKKYENWQSFHRDWADLYNYNLLDNYFQSKNFSSIVFSIHEPEFQIHKNLIDSLSNRTILGVKLESEKNKRWVKLAQPDLNFTYRFEEEKFYEIFLNSLDKTYLIDLDKILNSENEFINEYQRIVKLTGIKPALDSAVKLYKQWYSIRVKCYQQ